MSETSLKQHWTPKKIVCYVTYRLIARRLPGDIPFIGTFFQGIRNLVCKPLFKESGDFIHVGKGAVFGNGCNIIMRDNAAIGAFAELGGNHAVITIGRYVLMGNHCTIIAENRKALDDDFLGYEGKDIIIDDFAWLGDRTIILPGVRIGKHAIIGAGAVVPKDIPDFAIAVGNPAVVKKYRKLPLPTNRFTEE